MATAIDAPSRDTHPWRRTGAALLGAAAVLAALLGAGRLAGTIDLARIGPALAALPRWRIAAAIVLTAASHALLVGYDWIALRSIGATIPLRTAARASFTSYALSHNFGFAALTGGAARLRIYGAAGLGPLAVARVVLIAGTAFWGGVLAVAALSLMLTAVPLHFGGLAITAGQARFLGTALLAGMIALPLAATALPRLQALLRRAVPQASGRSLALLLAMGAADLFLSALALMVLLPGLAPAEFGQLYLVYALAIVAGLVTHVPGGIGVFEAVVLAGLPRGAGHDAAAIAAALLAYRAIYYVLPLAAALALNAAAEARGLRRRLAPVGAALQLLLFEASPPVMGALTFAGGLVLLLSGAMPAVHGRMRELVGLLPLPFIEGSHFAASLVGTALLLVAPALVDRLESGMRATRLLFMLGAAFSLAKGLDFEEAIVMLTLAGILQFTAPAFYRRTAGAFGAGNAGWLAAAAAAVALSAASGIHAYRHVAYDNQLWWEFALRGDAPRFLRASFAAGVLIAGVAASRLLHRPWREGGIARLPEEVYARATARCPRSDAALALTGDKRFLVHPEGDAFLMFRPRGRTWVVMGDPVGPPERWAELCWQLRHQSDACYARLCFYQISAAMLPQMIELGLKPIKYGEEAWVDPATFTLSGPQMKSLRNSHARARREGLELKVIRSADLGGWMPALARISENWLAERRQAEKSFSLGRFTPAYIRHFDVAVVVRSSAPDTPIAFANLWRSGDGHELSVDLMRHEPGTPPGTMDFLFTELITLAATQGFARFNLGLAPLSGVQGGKLAPTWARIANMAFALDASAYGFAGLRRYKAKFAPRWQARFIAAPTGIPGLRALVDLVRLVGD